MPRAERVFVEGGLHHVYNRVTRGEGVFGDEGEAERLVRILHEGSRRDGLVVLVWRILPNHYHLGVRTTEVPLWRAMATVQNRYARSFNGRSSTRSGGAPVANGPGWGCDALCKASHRPRTLRLHEGLGRILRGP